MERERGMGNGERGMRKGEWRMERRMRNGERGMENGEWNGEWGTGNEERRMGNGERATGNEEWHALPQNTCLLHPGSQVHAFFPMLLFFFVTKKNRTVHRRLGK